jgi:hypothetical protein
MPVLPHFLLLLLTCDARLAGCVITFFARPVKCVNDTTVLRRGKHAFGTVRSWGQTGIVRRESGATA